MQQNICLFTIITGVKGILHSKCHQQLIWVVSITQVEGHCNNPISLHQDLEVPPPLTKAGGTFSLSLHLTKYLRVPSNSPSLPSHRCLKLIPHLLSTFYHTYTRARSLGLLNLLQGLVQDVLFSVLVLLYMLRQAGGGIPGLDKHSVRKSTGLDLTEAVDALTQWAGITSEVQVGRLFRLQVTGVNSVIKLNFKRLIDFFFLQKIVFIALLYKVFNIIII